MFATRSEEYIEGPRHAVVTPDDNGAVLQIATYFLIVVAALATLLRLFLRVGVAHAAGLDDGLACLALLFAVGEVIATSTGVEKGLGTKVGLLTDGRILDVKKDVYVACIFYILAIAAAKASACFFIKRLVASKLHRLVISALSVLLAIWSIASVLTTALRCGLPHPWERGEGECLDMVPLSDAFAVVDIILDLALVAIPIALVWDLHMQRHEKAIVSLAFTFRLNAIATQIVRMRLMHQLHHSNDMSYDSLPHNIALQLQMALSILVASIPAYRPFMKRATSGMMSIRLGQGFGTYGVSGVSGDFPMDALSRNSNHTKKRGGQASAQASKFIRKTIEVAVDSKRSPDERHLNPCEGKTWDGSNSS